MCLLAWAGMTLLGSIFLKCRIGATAEFESLKDLPPIRQFFWLSLFIGIPFAILFVIAGMAWWADIYYGV